MKSAVCCAVAVAAIFATSVNAHGQMMDPKPRQVTDKYRADGGPLKNAGDDELQWAPLELLSQRKQADFPQAATFDMMNGCRGMVYEASSPVTPLKAGVEFTVKYYIQAPHPGYADFSIVKPKTGAGGKIKYERSVLIKRLENFATTGGNFETTLTIPTSVTGCEKAGACALQMFWYSKIANQTYPTCADITIGGSGSAAGGGGGSKTPKVTPKAAAKKATTKAPAGKSTPSKTSRPARPSQAEVGGEADDEDCEDELEIAGAPATKAPKGAKAPKPAKTQKSKARSGEYGFDELEN